MPLKISISIYGDNDDYVLKTHPSAVYFRYKYSELPSHIPRLNAEHQSIRRILINDHCCRELVNRIDAYEKKNNMRFDNQIFTPTNTIILDYPTVPGIYYTPYYSFTGLVFPNPLPCIEIISHTHVRINGGRIIHINDLDMNTRRVLFHHLFDGKVYDFANFDGDDTEIAMLIPSVINTSDKPFDYSERRSIFSAQERLEQTTTQVMIASKNASCYVLEGSHLDLRQLAVLSKYCTVVLFSHDDEGNDYANSHQNKSLYEIYVMREMLEKIRAQWYFKFGGRYHQTPKFKLDVFLKDKPVYKIIEGHYAFGGKDIVECIMYCFPFSHREQYLEIFRHIVSYADTTTENIETLLYRYSPTFECVDSLGLEGYDAIEGFFHIV